MNMALQGITVCVGYADQLRQILPSWLPGLTDLLVVTSPDDASTIELVHQTPGTRLFITNAFYVSGASFNKGRAMTHAACALPEFSGKPGWVCIFDADICPPAGWHEDLTLQPGNLYSAPRKQASRVLPEERWKACKLIPDREFAGYFWIFHTADRNMPEYPFWSSWIHAGNYDTEFQARWPDCAKKHLPFSVLHIGQPGSNWWGIGKKQKMKDMYKTRADKGTYEHERCP